MCRRRMPEMVKPVRVIVLLLSLCPALASHADADVDNLRGEPGIGKSRITQALRSHVARVPHTLLRYQCSPFHATSPLHPFVQQIEQAAGFLRDDTPELQTLDDEI